MVVSLKKWIHWCISITPCPREFSRICSWGLINTHIWGEYGTWAFILFFVPHSASTICFWCGGMALPPMVALFLSLHRRWCLRFGARFLRFVGMFVWVMGCLFWILSLHNRWRALSSLYLVFTRFSLINRATLFFYIKCRNPYPSFQVLLEGKKNVHPHPHPEALDLSCDQRGFSTSAKIKLKITRKTKGFATSVFFYS